MAKHPQVGKGKLKTRLNWGFWILLIGFVGFLVTWFVLVPKGVFG